jgi:hypothetical protein
MILASNGVYLFFGGRCEFIRNKSIKGKKKEGKKNLRKLFLFLRDLFTIKPSKTF